MLCTLLFICSQNVDQKFFNYYIANTYECAFLLKFCVGLDRQEHQRDIVA